MAGENSNYKELAQRYGLASASESVSRLTQLMARQDAVLGEIARLIDQEPALRNRLLRVANPGARSEADYTVETAEQALMRNGLGCALLLAMGTPLALALTKTFQTMLALKLETVDPSAMAPLAGTHLLGGIGFSGKAIGHVYLQMSIAAAKLVAATILGVPAEEVRDLEMVKDATGELLNIMTGNFRSSLCDAGLECALTTAEVKTTSEFHTPTERGGCRERMAFRTGAIVLYVDVTVNPWNED